MNCSEKGKLPVHKHGIYNKAKFGKRDESEAVKDYTELNKYLKNPRSKRMLNHIIKEEKSHKKEFKVIEKLECKARRKK
jgi:rubrerythrin